MILANKEMKQINVDLNPSLNPDVKYEKPFRPVDKLIFSGNNKLNTYSNDSIRVGNYDREGRYLYR